MAGMLSFFPRSSTKSTRVGKSSLSIVSPGAMQDNSNPSGRRKLSFKMSSVNNCRSQTEVDTLAQSLVKDNVVTYFFCVEKISNFL